MAKYLYLLLFFLQLSCGQNNSFPKEALPPDFVVQNSCTDLKNVNGTWYFDGQLFNGYIVEKDNGVTIAKLPIIGGKENGMAYGWYPNHKRKYMRHFVNGNRDGIDKGWYENNVLAFEYFFKDDKYEGIQKTFFRSGHKWQIQNYVNGYEEGKQKSWNDSGRVVNNFTIKNGKLYGVIGRFDCMSVHKK